MLFDEVVDGVEKEIVFWWWSLLCIYKEVGGKIFDDVCGYVITNNYLHNYY